MQVRFGSHDIRFIHGKEVIMNQTRTSGISLALSVFCGLLPAWSVQAQPAAFPNKIITIVTPYSPGGTDVSIRRYMDAITAEYPQWKFLLDYKQGAGGSIALGYVARMPGDGYTLGVISATFNLISIMAEKPSYDEKDFAPVYHLTAVPALVAVNAALPVKSLQEFIAYAKANPGKINYGMVGSSGIQRLTAEYLQELWGVKFTLIPYKGQGTVAPALLSGEIHASMQSPAPLMGGIRAGKVRGLATTGKQGFAFAQLPDIKTMAEAGAPAFEHVGWIGLHAPAATPLAVRVAINQKFNDVLKKPDVLEKFVSVGSYPGGESIQDYEKFMDEQRVRWITTANRVGIKLTGE